MRKKLLVIIFSVMLIICSIGEIVSKKKTFSEKENRYLQSWPVFSVENLLNGKYVSELEDYLADHFIFRDTWISINTAFNELTLKDEVNGVFIGKDGYLIEKYEKIARPDLIYKSINAFVQNNPNIKVEVMLVPTSIMINEDKLPANAVCDKQADDLRLINANLECEVIDLSYDLKQANKDKDVFYHLDHHWTTYGAYNGYLKYCEVNNLTPHYEDDYKIKVVTNTFTGTIYSKVGDYSLPKDSIETYTLEDLSYTVSYGSTITDTVYDKTYLDGNDKYGYFLSSNHPIVTIENNLMNEGEHLLIVKDSYANCFVPFLIEHYKYITLVDPRYYGKSVHDYILENKVDIVLFLYNMNTIGNDTGIRGIE